MTAGTSELNDSMRGDCGGDLSIPLVSFQSGKGSQSSMMTLGGDCGGGEIGLSMRE